MKVLTTHALTIGYKTRRKQTIIAPNLDLHLEADEVVCLLGENGAGKSTLIQTLTKILPALAGEVRFNNQNITKLSSQKLAQHMAVVLTAPITTNFSVRELVGTGRYPYTGQFGVFSKNDHEKINQALSETQTLHFAERKILSLSDGERQKVMIARALAQDTPLIILDEPTAHLDLPNRVLIFELLKKTARKYQKAILVSTHELDLALQVADKIWLQAFQKMETGAPEDLILNGSFERVFEKQHLHFEKSTGKFIVQNPKKLPIHIEIEGLVGIWTRRAIERIGGKHSTSIASPKIMYDSYRKTWIFETKNKKKSVDSIAELIKRVEIYWAENKA